MRSIRSVDGLGGVCPQGSEVGLDAKGERRRIVPPLKDTHKPAAGMDVRDLLDGLGHRLEVLDLKTEVTDRIIHDRVEPGTDEDELGPRLVGQVLQGHSEPIEDVPSSGPE